MKLVVGLGNLGEKYRFTRHNIGFMVIERLSGTVGTPVTRKRCYSLVGESFLDDLKIVLAKPQTYMNLSGMAVSALSDYYRTDIADLLVVCDDLDLPFGRIRLRPKGGSGGHRGLQSIITTLGSSEFPRLRVGIGKSGEAVDHVLGRFSAEDEVMLASILSIGVEAVITACRDGLEPAMNRFNGWEFVPEEA